MTWSIQPNPPPRRYRWVTALDSLDTYILKVFEGFAATTLCCVQRDSQAKTWRIEYGDRQESCAEIPSEDTTLDDIQRYVLVLLRIENKEAA